MKARFALMVVVLVGAAVLGACAPAATATPQTVVQTQIVQATVVVTQAAPKAKITIAYSAPSLTGGQPSIQDSLVRHAQALGWQVITTNANGDTQKQLNDIDYFITLGVSAIVAVPNDSAAICTAAAKAKAAGIPFYTIDRAPTGCAINMTVESNNRVGGQQAGTAMLNFLVARYGTQKGKVLEITGDMGQNVAQLRSEGFHDILDKYSNIKIITKVGNWNADTGAGIVRDVLAANPDLDGIYMASDAVYISGTLAELKAANKLIQRGQPGHVFLCSVDGSAAGVAAIKAGWMDENSAQPIPDDGLVVTYIQQELNGGTISPGVVTQAGALWSPGQITINSDGTPDLELSTTVVTIDNATNPGLWGNSGM